MFVYTLDDVIGIIALAITIIIGIIIGCYIGCKILIYKYKNKHK